MKSLPFTQMPLERHSRARANPAFISEQLVKSDAQLLVFYQDQLLNSKHIDDLLWFNAQEFMQVTRVTPHLYLGEFEGRAHFAIEITQQVLQDPYFSHCETAPFRSQLAHLPALSSAIAGYAKTLLHWHKTHRYCGRCGSQNHSIEGGYSRKCENQHCSHQTFPRHDPAVIMIVQKTFSDGVERCLLGRQASWPSGNYSALAGFVDAGESLEEAVIREVKEESGIDVSQAHYIASQPWPFPSSVMIGFIADACSEAIDLGEDELEDARWFSREELSLFGEWGDETSQFKKPRHSSISRHLLEYWINQKNR